MKTGLILASAVALSTTIAAASPSYAAFGGGSGNGNSSEYGDSFENDLQRNPRLIEPGMEGKRYLEYYGARGLDARREAWYGRRSQPSYGPNVRVRTYYGSGY